MKRISITVNGEKYDEHVPHRMLLVDFLRDQLGLTGLGSDRLGPALSGYVHSHRHLD